MSLEIHSTLLQNGLLIVTENIPFIESVSIRLLYNTGSVNEKYGSKAYIQGISHFTEHIHFTGTKERSRTKIAKDMDDIGGHFNAYTSRESTVYYTKVLKEYIKLAIDMIADITQNSIYDDHEIEKEKKIIVQEIGESFDSSEDWVYDLAYAKCFEGYQLGAPILGTTDSVMSISRDDIVRYVHDRYTYDNMIIAISGNISDIGHNALVELIEKKFLIASGMSRTSSFISSKTLSQVLSHDIMYAKADGISTLASSISNKNGNNSILNYKKNVDIASYIGGEALEERDIKQVNFILALKGVSYLDQNYYANAIAAIIAGGGMSSRLFQAVREKKGLAYSISAFSCSHKDQDVGLWGISASSGYNEINEVIDISIHELHGLAKNITKEELLRAKAQIKSSLLMAQESSNSRASKIVSNFSIFGRYIPFDEIINKIEAVNEVQIQNVIQNMIQDIAIYPPTIAAVGQISNMYRYNDIINKLYI